MWCILSGTKDQMDWLSSSAKGWIKKSRCTLSLKPLTKPFFCKLWDHLKKSNLVKWFWNKCHNKNTSMKFMKAIRQGLGTSHFLWLYTGCTWQSSHGTIRKIEKVLSHTVTYICIYFKIQDCIRIDCSVDVCLYTAYIDADDDDDDDEEEEGGEENRKRVFNWCFESAAPLRMISEPSSSSSNTYGRRMVWPQVATLKAIDWNLFARATLCWQRWCSYTGRCPCLRLNKRAPLKALSFGAGKKGWTHGEKHHAFFCLDRKGQWIRWF